MSCERLQCVIAATCMVSRHAARRAEANDRGDGHQRQSARWSAATARRQHANRWPNAAAIVDTFAVASHMPRQRAQHFLRTAMDGDPNLADHIPPLNADTL